MTYTHARLQRELRFTHSGGNVSPAELENVPDIDPRANAIESSCWGDEAYHLVHHQDQHYAWITCPGWADRVYRMPSEERARRFLAGVMSGSLLAVPDADCAVALTVLDPGGGSRLVYQSAVIDGADAGIWLAAADSTSGEEFPTLARFDHMPEAIEAFAVRAEQAADHIEQHQTCDYSDIVAGYLRYRRRRGLESPRPSRVMSFAVKRRASAAGER